MTQLKDLTKCELISRLLEISRENNRLKTISIREQLLRNLFKKLFQNCLKLSQNIDSKEIKFSLKSKQKRLLNQIRAIDECERRITVSLTKLHSRDLFGKDNWTQTEVIVEPEVISKLETTSKEPEVDEIKEEMNVQSLEVTRDQITREEEPKKRFECEICGKAYKQKKNLIRHSRTVHQKKKTEDLKREMVCQWPECDLRFRNRTLFLRHYSFHTESRRMCPQCGIKCHDWKHAREHALLHAQNGSSLRFRCTWISCDFSSRDESDFQRHVTKHSASHACSHVNCSYKTCSSSHLNTHEKSAHEKVYVLL